MPQKIRWGILSTGRIARDFASDLKLLRNAQIVAVGSRTQPAAEAFGDQFGIPRRYADYQSVASDPEVDVVYIGTPHHLHYENSLMCLRAGKAVLCEKPFAINARQAAEVIKLARRKRLFIMDAIWSRFTPVFERLRKIIAAGTLGDIRMVTADFGFQPAFNPKGRLFDPALGGGALLDIGIYPVMLASMIFGPPDGIASRAQFGKTKVDEQEGIVFTYRGGQMAVLSATFQATTAQEAHIVGTKGRLRIHKQWWHPRSMTLSIPGKPDRLIEPAYRGIGYTYEAAEVMKCLEAGQTECAIMPLDETLSIMKTLDAIRAGWGLKYPME